MRVIQFQSLDRNTIVRVVDKLIVELEAQLRTSRSRWSWTTRRGRGSPSAATTSKMGARPMARVIQEHIKRPLAEELLFGTLAEGGHVRIAVAPDGESLLLETQDQESPVPADG